MLKDEDGGENMVERGDAIQGARKIAVATCLEHHDDTAVIDRQHIGAGERGNFPSDSVLRRRSRLHDS